MGTENTPQVIELKEFIEETISQIVEGIKNAQERTEKLGALVNPRVSNSKGIVMVEDKYHSVQNIKFDVSLGSMSNGEGKNGFGVTFGTWGIGSITKNGEENKSVTNIKFSVPIIFPCIDNKEIKKTRVVGRP